MAVEKHIKLTGTSEISWKDAVTKTVEDASKTIDYLSTITILEQKARIEGNKMVEYYVDLDLSFLIDSER